MSQPVDAYLAIGSNVGDRLANLREAVRLLGASAGIEVAGIARVYETEPVGVRDQPWFLNSVVRVRTSLSPQDLLAAAKGIEAAVGRTPTYRWGPREIDVDVLLYDDQAVSTPDLIIPHARMTERLFVLLPLRDLLPTWRRSDGAPILDLIERLRGSEDVHAYAEAI